MRMLYAASGEELNPKLIKIEDLRGAGVRQYGQSYFDDHRFQFFDQLSDLARPRGLSHLSSMELVHIRTTPTERSYWGWISIKLGRVINAYSAI